MDSLLKAAIRRRDLEAELLALDGDELAAPRCVGCGGRLHGNARSPRCPGCGHVRLRRRADVLLRLVERRRARLYEIAERLEAARGER